MIDKKQIVEEKKVETTEHSKKPNEQGSFYFSTGIKIFDPQSNKVFVQKRCD